MKRSRLPSELNAGSMADIAFLLLIFFLVATTIENDKGITVQLPPYESVPPTPISDERVLSISLNGQNELLVENEIASLDQLTAITQEHLIDLLYSDIQPIVSILVDRNTAYEHYMDVYDAVKRAYNVLRDEASIHHFDKEYLNLDRSQKQVIRAEIPMIISEADPVAIFE